MFLERLKNLEKIIGYTFQDKNLLVCALTHPSAANEKGEKEDNQRMEFLGDSVLGLIITEELYKKYESHDEGGLSKLKSVLVSKQVLADYAKKIRLNEFILLGSGEENSGGRDRISNLADAFEALVGAIYLDSSLQASYQFIFRNFEDAAADVLSDEQHKNYKSYIQELAQKKFGYIPAYSILKEEGPEHDKIFTVQVVLEEYIAEGKGKSKKEAEQDAAKSALLKLEEQKNALSDNSIGDVISGILNRKKK